MKCKAFFAVCIALSSLAVASVQGAPATAAPDFTLPARDGTKVRLSDLKGQVVMINFWATWCGPCRQEMPLLGQLQDKYEPLGFTLLGVNVEPDSAAAVAWLKNVPVQFPGPVRHAKCGGNRFGVEGMPSTVFIDRDGERALRPPRLPARRRSQVRRHDSQPAEGMTMRRRLQRLLALLLAVSATSACSTVEPWVKPYERQNFADIIMSAERDPVAARLHRPRLRSTRRCTRRDSAATAAAAAATEADRCVAVCTPVRFVCIVFLLGPCAGDGGACCRMIAPTCCTTATMAVA